MDRIARMEVSLGRNTWHTGTAAERRDMIPVREPSGERVISGPIFTLTTSDPVRLPLPSFELLEMAWHLARVVSMSASGLLNDLDLRFEDDDDDIRPMAVPDRALDWLLPPQTPSSNASNLQSYPPIHHL